MNLNEYPDISNYGDVLTQYRGYYGTLKYGRYNFRGSFCVGQLSDGTIILIFSIRNPYQYVYPINSKIFFFSGICKDGTIIESRDFFYQINNLSTKVTTSPTFSFVLTGLSVHSGNNEYCDEIEFLLVNSQIPGNISIDPYAINVPWLSYLTIKKISQYESNRYLLQALHSVKPTISLKIGINNFCSLTEIEFLANVLCLALSVCNGTRVQWIQYQMFKDNELLQTLFVSNITRNYSPINDPIPLDLSSFKEFIESTYIHTKNSQKIFSAYLMLVNNSLLAKGEGYLEEKGRHAVITWEIINEFCINKGIIPNKGLIIKRKQFRKIQRGISEYIFKNTDKLISEKMIEKINELNHVTFKKNIETIVDCFSVPLNQDEIDFLIKSRNSLIHTGTFYVIKKGPYISKSQNLKINDTHQEYEFLINSLDKIILRIFGYSGYYKNRLNGRKEKLI